MGIKAWIPDFSFNTATITRRGQIKCTTLFKFKNKPKNSVGFSIQKHIIKNKRETDFFKETIEHYKSGYVSVKTIPFLSYGVLKGKKIYFAVYGIMYE